MNYFKKFKGGKSIEKFLDGITWWEKERKKGEKRKQESKISMYNI